MSDSIHLRGQGGGIFEFTPPLNREIQKQFNARKLIQVNADGSAYEGEPWAPDDPEETGEDDDAEDDAVGEETSAPKRGRGSKAVAEGA